jgi:hypothetical protein
MKQLFYDNKFYKDIDDHTASEIGMSLLGTPKPYHIMVDGEALKASKLEIRDPGAGSIRFDKSVPPDDIRKLENTYNKWQQDVPPEERSWEFFASVHNLITLHGVYLAPSGLKRCLNYSGIDPVRSRASHVSITLCRSMTQRSIMRSARN